MKRRFKLKFAAFFAALVLMVGIAPCSFCEPQPAHQASGTNYENMDTPETHSEEEQYLHSSSVKALAKIMHVSTETAANIFLILNSAIIWLGIIWFLVKTLPKVFRTRSETIQKDLADAHTATQEASKRLTAVEARLAKLDSEIEAIRKQVEQETLEDEKRIKASLEEERKRIIESAEREIESYGAAAQRDLKKFAAELAVDRALERIQLGIDADRILVRNFAADLGNTQGNGRKN